MAADKITVIDAAGDSYSFMIEDATFTFELRIWNFEFGAWNLEFEISGVPHTTIVHPICRLSV
jgi:hypothetical protein